MDRIKNQAERFLNKEVTAKEFLSVLVAQASILRDKSDEDVQTLARAIVNGSK